MNTFAPPLAGIAALLDHTIRRAQAFADQHRRDERPQDPLRIVCKWDHSGRDVATGRPKMVFEWAGQLVEVIVDDRDALHVSTSLRSVLGGS